MPDILAPQTAQKIAGLRQTKPEKTVWVLSNFQEKGVGFGAGHAFRVDRIHVGLAKELLRFAEKGTDENPNLEGDLEALTKVCGEKIAPKKIDLSDQAPLDPEAEPVVELVAGKMVMTKELIEKYPELSKQGAKAGEEVEIGILSNKQVETLTSDLKKVNEKLYTAEATVKGQAETIKGLEVELKKAKTKKASEEKSKVAVEKKKIEEESLQKKAEENVKAAEVKEGDEVVPTTPVVTALDEPKV